MSCVCLLSGARETRSLSARRLLALIACVLFCSGAAPLTSAQDTSVFVAMPSTFCPDSTEEVSTAAEGGSGGDAWTGYLMATLGDEVGCCGNVSACLSIAAGAWLKSGDPE